MGKFWWKVGMAIDSIAMKIDNSIYAVKDTCGFIKDAAKDTAEDFKELGEIVVEGTVDLAETAVADCLDYTAEKIDRYFENWGAVLSDDPYIDGKKNGYDRASYIFNNLYRKQDEENRKFLRIVKDDSTQIELKLQYIKTSIEKKQNELDLLKKKREDNIRIASEASGYSIEDVQVFITDTKCLTIFDLISNKRLKEMKRGELAGFNEAKALFEGRLNEMKEKYNETIDEIIINDEKELSIYLEICSEINQVNKDIVAMDIFIN